MTRAPGAPEVHVACVACGYDLRGLRPGGNCPECGLHVAVSHAARVEPVPPVDAAWRRHMIEAAGFSLAAFASLVLASFVPADPSPSFQWSTSMTATGFQTITVLAAVAWTTQWYAAVKLSLLPRSPRVGRAESAVAWALLGLATVYAALPAIARAGGGPFRVRPVGWMLTGVGPTAACFFALRLSAVFRRLGAPAAAGQARLVAFLMPCTIASSEYGGATPWGFLGLLIALPSYQFGRPSAPAFVLREMLRGNFEHALWAISAAAVPLCMAYLIVRLLAVAVLARPMMSETLDAR